MPASASSTGALRKCGECREGETFALPFTMAFQPIVELSSGRVFAYEALVRGPQNESAYSILSQINKRNRYGFDQACRVRAIDLAARLALPATGAALSINFMPNAVYKPETCIQATLRSAERVGFPLSSIIFEITEGEEVMDHRHLQGIVDNYKRMGFRTAIDDFGAGYSNLNLLARFQPDIIKLDMDLIRGIHHDSVRRVIVASMVRLCGDLGVAVVAEGVETEGEARALQDLGIDLLQGYLFARPGFQTLPVPTLPVESSLAVV